MASGKTDHEEYLESKKVKVLFESLTAGLVYHRPENHFSYLNKCLEKVKTIGSESVHWSTFVQEEQENGGSSQEEKYSVETGNQKDVKEKGKVQFEVEENNDQQLETNDDWGHLTSIDTEEIENEPKIVPEKKNAQNTKKTFKEKAVVQEKRDKETDQWKYKPKFKAEKKLSWQRKEDVVTLADLSAALGQDEEDHKDILSRQLSGKQAPNITDPQILKVLEGSFDDTPSIPTNTVRIFLSSTFSDFRAERNMLPKKAFPEIKNYCRDRGLDFQVIDMRWGVTDEMMNDHQVTSVCMREIKACQQISCGPNFVTLIGNRYGYRPIPSVIKDEEFELLTSIAAEQDKSSSQLLLEWYRKDENEVPAVYDLQPIASRLEYYNDESNMEMYNKHRLDWNDIFKRLYDALQNSSAIAVSKGLLDKESGLKYQISVTEEEVQSGLLKSSSAKAKSLCYRRKLQNLDQHLEKPNTGRFVDTVIEKPSKIFIDEDSKEKIEELCSQKIPNVLEEDIKRQYDLKWNGVNLENCTEKEFEAYLEKFCQDFVSDMKELVDKNLASTENNLDEDISRMYFEVVHHIKFAKSKLELFCGRNEIIGEIKDLITKQTEENVPIIVHGASGYGKTSLLAKCASLVPSWFSNTISVVRFLGTSPSTSNIKDTLISILRQLYGILNYTFPSNEHMETMGDVRRKFWNFITVMGEEHPDMNFTITLDSVDQLSEAYGAHAMTWLPRTLPPNVNILISTLSEIYTCLDNCKQRIPEPSQYVELKPLSLEVGEDIINTFLNIHNRRLYGEQKEAVKAAFADCSQPLFLKLTLDSTLQWSSYMEASAITVPRSVHAAITKLFEDLHVKYGDVFVSHALSYLTCGIGGLTDIEMEDVLSCDDDVLNEVYQYHDPPLEGTIRIPALMWARLGADLREYLTERQVDGKTVKTWYHRQFMETAQERYLTPDWLKTVHSNLAELFQQEDGIKRTIVLKKRKNKIMENADRLVTPQILNLANKRKLSSLSYHLFHGKQKELLKKQCFLNFNFVFTKFEALGIVELFAELEDLIKSEWFQDDKELMIIKSFIEISYHALKCDTNSFALILKERLAPYVEEYPSLREMANDAKKWMIETDRPLFIPTTPINLIALDTPIRSSFVVGMDGVISYKGDVVAAIVKQLFTAATHIQIFDLNNRDITTSIAIQKESPLCITNDDKHIIFQNSHKLKVCELSTGDLVKEISFLDEAYDSAVARSISFSPDGNHLLVAVKLGRPLSVPKSESWKQMVGLYVIPMNDEDGKLSIHTLKFRTKKPVDKVYFVDNGKKIVVFAREKFYVFSFPDLENIHESSENVRIVYGEISIHREEDHCIIAAQKLKKGCRFMEIDYVSHDVTFSDTVHFEGKFAEDVAPFGLATNFQKKTTILATTARKEGVLNSLWIKESEQDLVKINIGWRDFKQGTVLHVLSDWQYCLVGWKNGDVSVVCLEQKRELYSINGHMQQINKIFPYNLDRGLLTLSSDHLLKMWDTSMLLSEAVKKKNNNRKYKGDKPKMLEEIPLDVNEEVVNLIIGNEQVITVNPVKQDGPRIWNIQTGTMEKEPTRKFQEAYQESLEKSGIKDIMRPQRYHSEITMLDKYLVYTRKQRSHGFVYVTAIDDPNSLAHEHKPDSYFSVLPTTEILKISKYEPYMLIVHDTCVTKLSMPYLKELGLTEIPKISEQFVDMHSANTKKKLMYYKVAISTDGKYFIICNPAPHQKKKEKDESAKYFDLIEIESMTYKGRMELPFFTSWTILDDSYYYLVEVGEGEYHLYRPSSLIHLEQKPKYTCAVYNRDKSLLSKDNSIGLETTKKHKINVWNVEDKKWKMGLKGHTAEITCTAISDDNNFVVSGSLDKSLRLWSIETGQQLCLFYAASAINGAMFAPCGKYVATNYYCGSQKKRAAILEITNVLH